MPPIMFVVDRREAGQTLAAVLKTRFGLSWSQAKRLVEREHVKVSGQVESDVARRLKVGKRVELAAGTVEKKTGEGAPKSTGEGVPKSTGEGVSKRTGEGVSKRTSERAPKRTGEGVKGRTGEKKAPSVKPSTSKVGRKPEGVTPSPLHPFTRSSSNPLTRSSTEIVYQDESLVVVNKPAGLTTMRHKDEAAEFGERGKKFLPKTLADQLPALLGAPNRPVIAVHRIDRDTSGLVVFARTRDAAESLMKQFRKHTVDRRYLALTRGVPAPGRIESDIVSDRGDGRRGSTRKTNPPDGKRAVTHVKVLESFGRFALVECRLETGRTHQVRIHLGEAGAPLCGETVYDRPVNGKPAPDGSGASRPMLHATRLGFAHPETGDAMIWEAAPPEDFAQLMKRFRGL